MNVGELQESEKQSRLAKSGLNFRIGTFNVRMRSDLSNVFEGISCLYCDYEIVPDDAIPDFCVEVKSPSWVRKFIRPQVNFYLAGHSPFKPLPQKQAFAMFEWGLNWCVAANAHHFLNIHAAAMEKNNLGLILPGMPGSGKSTLCAALAQRGWRLLSDEMALISTDSGQIIPIPRPIALKNISIDIVRELAPDSYISPRVEDTAKGTIAHMRAPQLSIKSTSAAPPRLVIFPKYIPGSATELEPISKGRALINIAENSFNYNVLGLEGFRLLCETIDKSLCFTLAYSQLDDALAQIDGLVDAA